MNNEKDNSYKLYLEKEKTKEFTLLKSLDCENSYFDSLNNANLPFSIEFKETGSYINDFINSNNSRVIDYETILTDNSGNKYTIINQKEKWVWEKYYYKKINNKYKRFIRHSKECYIEYECVKV